MSAGEPPPALGGVLETSLYHDAAAGPMIQPFYAGTLGLLLVSSWPGGLAFRAGANMLLLFERETTAGREGPIADHGTTGPGHACLLASDPDAYEAWRERIAGAGVEITHEQAWDAGRRSFYFKDPAGNLLEIADGDIWPQA